MSSENLPSGDVLRRTTCVVVENMWGQPLEELSANEARDAGRPDAMVSLHLAGAPDFVVVVGWTQARFAQLRQIFCGATSNDQCSDRLVLDALGEVLNIVAGQLKTELALDHALGLPQANANVPVEVGTEASAASSGWVRVAGDGPVLFVGAYPSALVSKKIQTS